NVTVDASGGGLGLPRVQLADRANLEPFISATDPDWLANTDNIKEHHAGLTVYNLTDDTLKNFRQGIYVWNGDQWSMMGGKRHFYMPSFNIEVKVDSTYECDLYEAYKRQFEKAGSNLFVSNNSNLETISSLENGDIYASRELDYVVTYYDAAVMDPPTIANDGKMTFTVTDVGSISAKTFFTVLLVVK
ncbi:MAG: hypothetical protein LBT25_09145, partial [Candidatus Symbiothrix sp.]|nr:hypothetical protein [Candidatus Symbiothrix sp.]